MKTVGRSATIAESQEFQLSKQIATNDDAAANEEEAEEQLDEDSVKRAARDSATGFQTPILRGNEEIQSADDAVASGEEVEAQAEESRIDKVAFEDGMSTASAEEYIKRGHTHD